MRTFVVRNGGLEPDTGYEKGPLLLHPEVAWRARFSRSDRDGLGGTLRRPPPAFILVPLILIAFILITSPSIDGTVLLPVILFPTMGLVWWVFLRLRSQAYRTGPAVGLYGNGVQVTYRTFVPYEEIEGLERRHVGSKGYDCVAMHLRVGPNGAVEKPLGGTMVVFMSLLGEDGLAELMERVQGPISPG